MSIYKRNGAENLEKSKKMPVIKTGIFLIEDFNRVEVRGLN